MRTCSAVLPIAVLALSCSSGPASPGSSMALPDGGAAGTPLDAGADSVAPDAPCPDSAPDTGAKDAESADAAPETSAPEPDQIPPNVSEFHISVPTPAASPRVSFVLTSDDPGSNPSGVVGWAITESSAAPAPSEFASLGDLHEVTLSDGPSTTRTLYPWVVDGAGNTSSSISPLVIEVDPKDNLLNTHTGTAKREPAMVMAPDGTSVALWTSNCQDACGGGIGGIYGRRLAADGTPLTGEFRVNTNIADEQAEPAVGMAPGGEFIVAWQSAWQDGVPWGIYAQRFDKSAKPIGTEFRVSPLNWQVAVAPTVAVGVEGRVVIAWEGTDADGVGGVFFQRLEASGGLAGSPTRVGSTGGNTSAPSVAPTANGGFVIVWGQGYHPLDVGGGVVGRCFDSSGQPVDSEEFLIDQRIGGQQGSPRTGTDQNGAFVVTWHDSERNVNVNGDHLIGATMARRFGADCKPLGDEFQVNRHIVGNKLYGGSAEHPAIHVFPGGEFIIAWAQSQGTEASIFARRFDANGQAIDEPFCTHWTTDCGHDNPTIAGISVQHFAIGWLATTAGPTTSYIYGRMWK